MRKAVAMMKMEMCMRSMCMFCCVSRLGRLSSTPVCVGV